jgi:LmbE family N-acetylglucosaminyl deacetylase
MLALAPHPDDFDAIGVTLKHIRRNGNPIEVGVVRTGSGVEDSYRPDLTLA